MQKLNRENAEKSGKHLTPGYLDLEAGVPPKDQQPDAKACQDEVGEEQVGEKVHEADIVVTEKEPKLDEEDVVQVKEEEKLHVPEEKTEEVVSPAEEVTKAPESPAAHADDKKPTATR